MRPEVRLRLLRVLICLLPFVALYWLLPVVSDLTIGNDYGVYSIEQQMELQYSLAHGSFPLYSPGFAGGRSSAALTLGQLYHPISYLAANSPGYWEGGALEWNTIWRLISLGLTQLVLFNLLLRLGLKPDASFIVSWLTVYNQRMLDMFRYGASLESYTGFLLLCAAMTWLYLAPDNFVRPLSIIGATYLLVCGGHPQIAFLGLLGSGLVYLVIPGVVSAIRPEIEAGRHRMRQYYVGAPIYVGLGILCSAAYIVPFYFEFLRDAPARLKRPYSWSLANSDHWGGALNSFFNPLRSDVHGAFGSSPLILLAVLAPLVIVPMTKLASRRTIVAIWLLSIFVFLCSIGSDGHLYYWFWKIVPLADSFRTPGRIAMLLPPLFMFILAWFFNLADDDTSADARTSRLLWSIGLAAVVLFIIGYMFLSHAVTGSYSPMRIAPYPLWVNGLIFACGIASLILVTLRVSPYRAIAPLGALLAATVILQSVVQLRHGTWIAARGSTPTIERIDAEKRANLAFRGEAGFGMESATPAHLLGSRTRQLSFQPSTYRYPTYNPKIPMALFHPVSTMPASNYLPSSPQKPGGTRASIPVETLFSSFNRLVLKVYADSPGFLTLTVPYSTQWRAFVGSQECEIRPTDEHELAVVVPVGTHEVDLRFHSRASLVGLLISCAAILFAAIYYGRNCKSVWLRNAIVIGVIIMVPVSFALLEYSLYTGDDLGTQFKSPLAAWTRE